MPVDAIALVDAQRGTTPVGYYRQVPFEPIPAGLVSVKSAAGVKSSMIDLLNRIASAKSRNVVVVSHGGGTGLAVPLAPGSDSNFVSPNVETLLNSNGKVTPDLAIELGIKDSQLKALQAAATRVRKLKLGRVDFRACTLGEFPEHMEQVRGFFGAGAISAPTRLDFFGGVRPGTPTKDAEAWKKWASDHPFGKIEGDPPNRVGFEAVSEDDIAMQFESPAGLRAWLAAKFPGHKYKSGPVFFHGFLDANALIFPGDTTYRDQIAQVP